MQIFILDYNPYLSSTYLCDKHIVKMPLEGVQILSTCKRLNNINEGYKLTHIKHPCVLWSNLSLSNWLWLYEYTDLMFQEYFYRYDKITCKSYEMFKTLSKTLPIKDIGLTPFAQAIPEKYKVLNDPVTAYRNFYINEKSHFCKWKKRDIPHWFKEKNI